MVLFTCLVGMLLDSKKLQPAYSTNIKTRFANIKKICVLTLAGLGRQAGISVAIRLLLRSATAFLNDTACIFNNTGSYYCRIIGHRDLA
jgi:hypothetical protein